jgi:hypothetical protein
MDTITMDTLKNNLLAKRSYECVSLFMPTHRAGRETEQNTIRFKNLLREAEDRLLMQGLRPQEVRAILESPRRLLNDLDFWQHQSDGLAVFSSEKEYYCYRLPLPFEELMIISNRFHVKPLLPLFAGDGRFYVLALSQNQIRLLEGTKLTVDEVDLQSVPGSLAEAFESWPLEKQLQFHTGTPSVGGTRAAVFHGHDMSKKVKAKLLNWFRMIDKELSKLLAGVQTPVVLAGVESLCSLYREASTYSHLVDKGISGNPEELKSEELHSQGYGLVEPVFMKAREDGAAQYRQLAGTGQTTTDVQEAVKEAYHGRLSLLFVALAVQVWGRFDPDLNSVEIHEDPKPGDEDLLDLAAIQCLLNGGTVFAVEPDQVPGNGLLAVIFRY